MFSEGFVCPRGAGGGVSVSVKGGLCPGGVSVQGGLCQGDPPYGNERTVRILMECILVCSFLFRTEACGGSRISLKVGHKLLLVKICQLYEMKKIGPRGACASKILQCRSATGSIGIRKGVMWARNGTISGGR